MSQSSSWMKRLIGIAAIGAVVTLSACAPEPQPSPTPTGSPETPETYTGPVAFIGDELDWFLLSPEEIASTLPDVGDVSPSSSSLLQISDGGGYDPVPSICLALTSEPSLGSIGSRSVTWTNSVPEGQDGGLNVLQFADEDTAKARMDQYIRASEECGEFTYGGPSSFESTVMEGDDGVRVIAGSLVLTYPGGGHSLYKSFSSVGNVIVEMWQPFTGDPAFDSEAAAALLRDRASEAKGKLIDELTANPPAPAETPAPADPAAAWSTWEITDSGIGPVLLGVESTEAIAAVPGAEIEEPAWEGGPTRLIAPDGSASILIWPQEEGTVVAAVSVGTANVFGDRTEDGAALPSASGVKVGDPVAAAVAAFPEGTSVQIVSSGEDFYRWSTREGVSVSFRTDRDATEEGAVIIGIRVDDATLSKRFSYE